jgi:regulator of cell morphogenesis and NO signaling
MTPQTTVREIAVAIPASVRIFEKYSIDFCCNGNRPLDKACREAGVSPAAVLDEVRAAGQAGTATAADWTRASLSDLIAHIVTRHHGYLEAELPRIEARLGKVVEKHGEAKSWLFQARDVFLGLRDELFSHLRKEETILFPYIESMESGRPAHACFPTVAAPIRMMFFEHDNAGAALAELRRLSDGYTTPEDGCPTFRALMHDLAALEADLHQHIHLENNILFPRAIEMEGGL